MKTITNLDQIQEYMGQLGVSELETRLYLKLLELGPTSMSELAKVMGMARTTVFENTEKLLDKGLLTRTVRGKRKLLVAEEPGKVKLLVVSREMDLEKKQNELEGIKFGLDGFIKTVMENVPRNSKNNDVSVRFYQGKDEVNRIYIDSTKSDEVYSFANVDKYYEIFSGYDNPLWEAMEENKKRKVWDILVNTSFARENAYGHDRYLCKFLPESDFFSGFDLLIYDDKVSVIQLEKENVMAVQIKSELLSTSIKGLHISMWGLLS